MSGQTFVGLDGEMTGSELEDGYALIQIGLAIAGAHGRVASFVSDIGQPTAPIDPDASAVHGFSDERIRGGPPAASVDRRASRWLHEQGGDLRFRSQLIPVGWNVAGFDLPFVRRTLPSVYAMLSRRSVDLNAVCFTLAGRIHLEGSYPKFSGLKRMAKRHAEARLAKQGVEPAWHDAGYDAAAALVALHWFRDAIEEAPPAASTGGEGSGSNDADIRDNQEEP